MARCRYGCSFIDEVHDFGCAARREVYDDPELSELYATETATESTILDLALQKLLGEAGMSEWDPEAVEADTPAWLAVRKAVRAGIEANAELPVRIVWNEQTESPWLELREG